MNKYDIQDRYRKWWVGKKCRPVGYMGEFKRVKDVIFHSSFSGVYGSGELIYEDGTTGLITCGEAFKPRKKDVEVMGEENESAERQDKKLPFFVDEVIVLKEAINDIVSDPETKRRIYNRASELMERRKTENKQNNGENEKFNLH